MVSHIDKDSSRDDSNEGCDELVTLSKSPTISDEQLPNSCAQTEHTSTPSLAQGKEPRVATDDSGLHSPTPSYMPSVPVVLQRLNSSGEARVVNCGNMTMMDGSNAVEQSHYKGKDKMPMMNDAQKPIKKRSSLAIDEPTEYRPDDHIKKAKTIRKMFSCKVCNMSFRNAQELGGHKKSQVHADAAAAYHRATPPSRSTSTTEGSRGSENPDEYNCEFCNMSFRSAQELGGHKKSQVHADAAAAYHRATTPSRSTSTTEGSRGSENRNEYNCEFCNMSFRSAQELGGHKKSQVHADAAAAYHSATPPSRSTSTTEGSRGSENLDEYNCEACNMSFWNAQELEGHKKSQVHADAAAAYHRATPPSQSTSTMEGSRGSDEAERRPLDIDLNEKPDDDEN